MGIDLVSDIDDFLDEDEFAVQITYDSVQIPAIFDAGFQSVSVGGMEIEGQGPTAMVKSADVDGIAHLDQLVIPVDGTQTKYKVVGIQPDGTGLTTLILLAI